MTAVVEGDKNCGRGKSVRSAGGDGGGGSSGGGTCFVVDEEGGRVGGVEMSVSVSWFSVWHDTQIHEVLNFFGKAGRQNVF